MTNRPNRILAIFLAAGFLTLLGSGCSPRVSGSGQVTSETRPVSGVNAVSLEGVGDLTIVQGEPESLVIKAEDNLLPLIRTTTDGGLLEISEKGSFHPTKPINFQLTISNLTKVISAGAGSIHNAKLNSPALLDIRVEGAGTVDFADLECASLKLVLSGAGNVKLQGRTLNQTVDLSGAGKYLADDLRTRATKLTISGVGSAKVWAVGTLDVNISGAGSVDYYGSPEVKRQIDGVGSLHALGNKGR